MPRAKRADEFAPELFDGLETEAEKAARRELLEHLTDAGASEDVLKKAVRQGTLATLPLEFALVGERRYTLTQVARKAKLESAYLRHVLLSLGHPNPRTGEAAFSDEDVDMARTLRAFLDAGLPKDGLLEVARVLGQSTARTAAVIREVAGSELIEPGDSEVKLGMRYAAAAEELIPMLGPILQYELRVHLREQATRDVITRAERDAGELSGTRDIGACFVDLTGFTHLSGRTSAQRVGAIGDRLAALVADVAHPPVELVKTLGDGALIISTEIPTLIDAILELFAKAQDEGDGFPELRGGISFGQAVERGGDWFGPAVNRASRIVDVAKPSTILAEEAVQERAGGDYEWSKRRLRKRLDGVDERVKLYRLHPSGNGR
jgi:adenylate cyclase